MTIYYRDNNTSVFNVRDFGARGNDSHDDTQNIINAYIAAISSTYYFRPTLLFPEGMYYITSGLYVPPNLNVTFEGAKLNFYGAAAFEPILTIGSSGVQNSHCNFLSLNVDDISVMSHDFPPSAYPNHCAIRFINVSNADIHISRTRGTYVGMQFLAQGGYCAYNNVRINTQTLHKVYTDCRSYDADSWVNENKFYGGNFEASSSLNNYGSCDTHLFSRESGAYSGQNHNQFFGPCYQLGRLSNMLTHSSGLAVEQYYRLVNASGWEYLVATSGNLGGTAPAHTSGTIANGTATLTFLGDFRRCPLHFNDAGGNVRVYGARVEGTIGPIARMDGAHGDGNAFEFDVIFKDSGNSTTDIEDAYNASNIVVKCVNEIKPFRTRSTPKLTTTNWHKRAIRGQSKWNIAGVNFIDRLNVAPYFYQNFGINITLCATSLFWESAARYMPCIIIDTNKFKRFRIYRDNGPDLGRINVAALDSNFLRIDIGTDAAPTLPLPLAVAGGEIIEPYIYIATSSDSEGPQTIVAGPQTKYVAVWTHSSNTRGFSVEPMLDTYNTNGTFSLVNRFGNPNDTVRVSDGMPTLGFFETMGEFISNVNVAVGQPCGYFVNSTGVLASPWGASSGVIEEQMVSHSGRVYYASVAHTTNSTPPSHTTGTTNNFTYYSNTASLISGTVL